MSNALRKLRVPSAREEAPAPETPVVETAVVETKPKRTRKPKAQKEGEQIAFEFDELDDNLFALV